jgi:redox-sensitive bicupin YhaK (pirin superfamily)
MDQYTDGVTVRVIAGKTANGVEGPVQHIPTEAQFMDVQLHPAGIWEHSVPDTHNALLYVFDGNVSVLTASEETEVRTGQLAVLTPGEAVRIEGALHGRFLWIAGRPLQEPVVQRGPFVMNTAEEIEQAFADYSAGRLG